MTLLQAQPSTYTTMRQRQMRGALRQTEIPIEHAVSLPLPTRRGGVAAYACFAGPAQRRPGVPARYGTPDRWWMVDESGRHLILYALVSALPFAPDLAPTPVTAGPVADDLAAQADRLAGIAMLLDALAPDFFAGRPGDEGARRALAEALTLTLPAPLLPWYRALTPDFFAWIEAA